MNTTRQSQRRFRPNRHGGAQEAPSLGSQIDATCRENSKTLLCRTALFPQHFAMNAPDTAHVSKTPINQVLAENLAHFMEERGLNQVGLSKKSGISQRSISNYLNPDARATGKSGKAPSAKLSEVELIADSLDIEAWQLLRKMTDTERVLYSSVERAFKELLANANAAAKAVPAAEQSQFITRRPPPTPQRGVRESRHHPLAGTSYGVGRCYPPTPPGLRRSASPSDHMRNCPGALRRCLITRFPSTRPQVRPLLSCGVRPGNSKALKA